jgi:hypothetical protein
MVSVSRHATARKRQKTFDLAPNGDVIVGETVFRGKVVPLAIDVTCGSFMAYALTGDDSDAVSAPVDVPLDSGAADKADAAKAIREIQTALNNVIQTTDATVNLLRHIGALVRQAGAKLENVSTLTL